MTSTGGVWPLPAPGRATVTQSTTNSQYGQWFDASRATSSSSAFRHLGTTATRLYEHPTSSATLRIDTAASADHSHVSRDQFMSRDHLASRDQLVTSSCDASSISSPRNAVATLPLSLQRSATTLGRFSTSGSGTDGPSSLHGDLIRDYRRYRQLQAGITGDSSAWRGRLLTRPTTASSAVTGQTDSVSSSSSNVESPSTVIGTTQQQQQQRQTETTTVVPLQLGVGGPLPLQRSVANVMTARRPFADFTSVRRSQTGRPTSSSNDGTADLQSEAPRQQNSIAQEGSRTTSHNVNYTDVTQRSSPATSIYMYGALRGQEDISRHMDITSRSSDIPRRSILKKPVYTASRGSDSSQIQPFRPSAFSGGVCRQQVLAGDRVMPVYNGTERSRTAGTKRVTFCV